MKLSPITIALLSSALITNQIAISVDGSNKGIEIITISAPKLIDAQTALAEGNLVMPDVTDWLTTVPGANINKNGPITGIVQYRGMFGDRVAKSISGHQIISAGPNAMDAPLTYINPIMVESVSVYRGIAPVSAGMDTIGGAIEVNLKRAVPNGGKLFASGDITTSYNSVNDATTLATNVNIASDDLALLVYISEQQGDDYQDANGNTIKSTQYDKRQYGLDSRYVGNDLELGLTWHQSSTNDSGTPALPMDIDYIDSKRFNTDGQWQQQTWQINWQFGYQDATHGMDNFSQRVNIMDSMVRYNTAKAKTLDYKFSVSNDDWLLALEGFDATHHSTITNPNNKMFKVANFNDVKDARHSLLVQYSAQPTADRSHTIGLRVKQNLTDAGDVMTSMAMMSKGAKTLQNAFNTSDRSISDVTADLVINSQQDLSDTLEFTYGLGYKQRAPSYQERYLWMPMQATGGLADGKTYVGNINLKPETAYQLDLGLSYNDETFAISPHVYVQRVNNYIQGTLATDMSVKMVAAMMGSTDPLQFANIDASLYGADINWHLNLSDSLKLSGIASYVRGERRDSKDDLYRMMPLNTRVNLFYHQDNWQTNLSLHAYNKQTAVASLNNETASAGYAVIDWQADYFVTAGLVVKLGVNNLTDKQYNAHLSGVNRAKGSDIAVGQRIKAPGRNVYLALDYQF